MADAADLKSASTFWSMGSSPIPGTINFLLIIMKNISHIDKDQFIFVCNQSLTMAEAARILNISYKVLIKYAKLYGCYHPNQGR